MPAGKSNWSRIVGLVGPFLILGFVLGLFAAIMNPDSRDTFFSLYNFKTILTQTVIVAIGALGMTMIIVSAGIDLSVGSVIALTSVIGAVMINQNWVGAAVIGLCILGGGLVGLLNGVLLSGFRM